MSESSLVGSEGSRSEPERSEAESSEAEGPEPTQLKLTKIAMSYAMTSLKLPPPLSGYGTVL